ncbi:hypothetical protein ACWGIV_26685 [Streptomyces sp. NPDC054844]
MVGSPLDAGQTTDRDRATLLIDDTGAGRACQRLKPVPDSVMAAAGDGVRRWWVPS